MGLIIHLSGLVTGLAFRFNVTLWENIICEFLAKTNTRITPALTPNRCRNFQLFSTCETRNPEWETSVGDKCGRQVWETSVNSAQRTQSGRQVWETRVGDKCKLMRSQTSRVGDTCGRQVGDKCKIMRPKTPRVGDKCGRQVGDKFKTCSPRHPEWETSVEDKCGRQVGDKCKIMRPRAPRVKDQCGSKRKTSVNSCGPRHPSVRDKWETSVKSCGPSMYMYVNVCTCMSMYVHVCNCV